MIEPKDLQQLQHDDHKPSRQLYPLCYLAHDLSSPANLGILFRIADGLGVSEILLSGNTPQPPNRKIRKTSRSTDKYVTSRAINDPVAHVTHLRSQNYRIIALEITTQSIALDKLKLDAHDKVCLILGAENKGVPDRLLELSNVIVQIPMLGNNSSMNVANAAAITTYEITQQLTLITS